VTGRREKVTVKGMKEYVEVLEVIDLKTEKGGHP
jgi:hypothetical protein